MREDLKKALEGPRNAEIKKLLTYFIDIASTVKNVDGKIQLFAYLMEHDKGIAYVVANWDDYENCNAKITHDLNVFKSWDLGSLISKMRIN